MPTPGPIDYKKPSHRRNDSDELDVFPAARYYNDNFTLTQKVILKDQDKQGYSRGGRVSLDMPIHHYNNKDPISQPYPQKQLQPKHLQLQQVEQMMKDKKHKQPSSPGGKLAHFLNTLFNQTSSKNKKNKPSSKSQSIRDEDERRKRRSSISNFRSTSSAIDAKSIYSSSSSGFRTPPYNINKPNIKCYQDLNKTLSDHKQVLVNLSNYSIKTENYKPRMIIESRGIRSERSSLDEKFEFKTGFVEKKIESFKEEDMDDGEESDSSADLFELQIHHKLGFSSTNL